MNFVGHLADYCGTTPDWSAPLALGVMWSDLRKLDGFEGASPVEARHQGQFEAGLAIHRRQDAVFHDDRLFLDTCMASTRELVGGGLGRGPARAFSHVAYELRLDGLLLEDPDIRQVLASAMGAVRPDGLRHDPSWLIERAQSGYGSPGSVARVVVRILSARPRLAIEGANLEVLAAMVEAMEGPGQHASALLERLDP